MPSQCKSHSCQRASDVDFYVDVGEKLFEHSKTILAALESRSKEERGFTKSKIELQIDNNTLKARHKELTVDTSLLICTLEVPKSCTAVHSSRCRLKQKKRVLCLLALLLMLLLLFLLLVLFLLPLLLLLLVSLLLLLLLCCYLLPTLH